MKKEKENFLRILSSMKPEQVTELIFNNSKIKPVKNVVVRIKGYTNNK